MDRQAAARRDTIFPKWAGSAFVNPQLDRWLQANGVKTLRPARLMARACITATAKDALRRGLRGADPSREQAAVPARSDSVTRPRAYPVESQGSRSAARGRLTARGCAANAITDVNGKRPRNPLFSGDSPNRGKAGTAMPASSVGDGEPAGFWRRAIALAVDVALVAALLQGLGMVLFSATDGRIQLADGLSLGTGR